MVSSVSGSRLFSLRAPITTEAERAFFQRRLALTLLVVFALASIFFVLQLLAAAVIYPDSVVQLLSSMSMRLHLTTTFAALVGALLVRRGHPSSRVLDAADAIAAVALGVGWAAMIYCEPSADQPAAGQPWLVAFLATTYTLATRAALVPSTPARTALLGLAAMIPLIPITYSLARQSGIPPMMAMGATIDSGIWVTVGIACTTTISQVIYGLQLQVRKAMQLGQYLLEEKIGEGGMGVVYRASHAMLRRPTAIKLLTGSTGNAAERFEREVQITARLTHPNTVVVFDYGRTPEGVFYYAMEYLNGITLQDLVDELGPLSPARVAHVLLQVCGALEEAHANGLVHRDIKPANVMLTDRGGVLDVVKVLDFGLVKEIDRGDASVTSSNTILGTPDYMAPEAIIEPNVVDPRTDLYAVGAMAYFLLVGQTVFDGSTVVEVCGKHLYQPPQPLAERGATVPPALEEVVMACLAKKPDDRPVSAAALADMLRASALPEWTRADARAWWDLPEAKARRSGVRAVKRAPVASGVTVAVTMEGRGAA
jgi:hypothetical protein